MEEVFSNHRDPHIDGSYRWVSDTGPQITNKTPSYRNRDSHYKPHYNDVIMSAMASQITRLTIVNSTVYSGTERERLSLSAFWGPYSPYKLCTDQRKHQSSMSLAFARGIHRWPVNSPHKGPVTWKMFPLDDVIMWDGWQTWIET